MRRHAAPARSAAAAIALGACFALPVSAGAESPQATIRTFELRIAQRRVPPAQRVLCATHVLAMYVAHRLALARFSTPRIARRSQYLLAALMVGYTMLSLWILAQPIVVK